MRGPVPEAGLVVLAFTNGPPIPPFPGSVDLGGYVWGKNVVGKFRVDNPEPFQGRAAAVGKFECRVIPPTEFGNLNTKVAAAPLIPSIRIEQTGEPDIECGGP